MTPLHKGRVNRENTMVKVANRENDIDGAAFIQEQVPGARKIWATLPEYETGARGLLESVRSFAEDSNECLSERLVLGLALCETAPDGVEEDLDILSLLGVGWERVAGPDGVIAFQAILLSTRRG